MCRPVPARRFGPGGGLGRTAPAGRVTRGVAPSGRQRAAALGRDSAWPPAGTCGRPAGSGLARPLAAVAALVAVIPAAVIPAAVIPAAVAPAAAPGTGPVSRCLSRVGGSCGRGGPVPGRLVPGRLGPGLLSPGRLGPGLSGCPAGPDIPRCCRTKKLSAPEQNSDAEGERREDTHGDRSVDQSQAGREHPGHQHRHRRNRQEGTGPDHVRPPTTRRGSRRVAGYRRSCDGPSEGWKPPLCPPGSGEPT